MKISHKTYIVHEVKYEWLMIFPSSGATIEKFWIEVL